MPMHIPGPMDPHLIHCDRCDRVGAIPHPFEDETLCPECEHERDVERLLTSRPFVAEDPQAPRPSPLPVSQANHPADLYCRTCGAPLAPATPGGLGKAIRRVGCALWSPKRCVLCHGAGRIVDDEPCDHCGGTGKEP